MDAPESRSDAHKEVCPSAAAVCVYVVPVTTVDTLHGSKRMKATRGGEADKDVGGMIKDSEETSADVS